MLTAVGDPQLPAPATSADLFSQAIYDVLRQIRDRLPEPTGAPLAGAPVELREPDATGTPIDAPAGIEQKTPPVTARTGRPRRTSAK